jgi:hypothetical protein
MIYITMSKDKTSELPIKSLNMNNNKIINVSEPTNENDVVIKSYFDKKL